MLTHLLQLINLKLKGYHVFIWDILGYKFLNLTNQETFISRYVTFYEGIFPLNTNTKQPYMHPYPTPMPNTQAISAAYDIIIEDPDTKTIPESQIQNNLDLNVPLFPTLRRSSRQHKQPNWLISYDVNLPHTFQAARVVGLSVAPQFDLLLSSIFDKS